MPSEKPPIPVHALDDRRIHLAPPHHGRLRQGRLKTLCGKLAVSELPLFAMAETGGRCPACFRMLAGGTAEKPANAASPKAAAKKAASPAGKPKPAASKKKR